MTENVIALPTREDWAEVEKVNHELAVKVINLMAALDHIVMVCTDNMDRDCDHRMALDFVRQIANDATGSKLTEIQT